jgi:type IV fimbrial biogenesis protein FimT
MKGRRPGGFTIVELYVSLAILAVLLGIGIPTFRYFKANRDFDNAFNQLVSDLRYAREQASALNEDGTVSIASSGSPQTLYRIANDEGGQVLTERTFPEGVTASEFSVSFEKSGTVSSSNPSPDSNNEVEIAVSSERRSKRLWLNATTGAVRTE